MLWGAQGALIRAGRQSAGAACQLLWAVGAVYADHQQLWWGRSDVSSSGSAVRGAGVFNLLRPLAIFAALALLIFTLSRLGLAWIYADRLASTGGLPVLLPLGLRFDLVIISAACLLALLPAGLLPGSVLRSPGWERLMRGWLAGWLGVLMFNEAATPAFMAEFGVRPNRVYVEYLDTPGLVLETLWHAHPVALILGCTLAAAAVAIGLRLLRPARLVPAAPGILARLLVLLPMALLLGIGVRGSLDHRPLSPSNAAFSTDSALNDLALNSTYSAVYAIRELLHERDVVQGYGDLPGEEVVRRVRAGMQLPETAFTSPDVPTRHRLVPTARLPRKPNLVILLQESLGAQYFATRGGRPVATRLERWRTRSLWFDQLYASGTRSARGVEAVVTGFLPTRASSVIKLEGAQRDFFTLAAALKAEGYRTEFIYGGNSTFDNMRRFFLNNGFDRVLDQDDLAAEAPFATTWGVADEYLYARLHRDMEAHDRDDKPWFTLVFSTSNHPPYDFPDGRIELFEEPKHTHDNSARYADFATDAFLEQASHAHYWENTVFMLVADHESKTIGPQLVPIFSFHIPAFITGGVVQPRVISRLASQIDLLPTVLSVMGLSPVIPATGIDQSRTDLVGPGRAIMQFNDSAAYRVGDDVVILMPRRPIEQFKVVGQDLVPVATDVELSRDALAHSLLPLLAYRGHWYH